MCERVTTTKNVMLLIKAGDSLTDVQWLLHNLQDCGCDCMILIQADVTPSHADVQWLQLQVKIMVVRWSGKLPALRLTSYAQSANTYTRLCG